MKLAPVQREILLALIDLYHAKGETVKGEDIAALVKKNPGTIRNQMQALRNLGLVEGVPGPKGGYIPTTEGYKTLDFETLEKEVRIPIFVGETMLEGLTVRDIDLIDIADPDRCRATIHVIGSLKNIGIGEMVRIGPTPVNKLMINGKVLGRDDMDNVLLIEIVSMFNIPKEKISEVASRKLKTITTTMTVRQSAELFAKEKIRGAPVVEDGKPIGMLSTVDVTRALAESREDGRVGEVMSRDLHTIDENAMLSQAIVEMEKYNISRLIVVNRSGKAKGVVTRTDVLERIADISRATLDMLG
ncbi:MAG: CBS domain-containing protein [Candidatus Hydrothermarchaeaceae archaeon]